MYILRERNVGFFANFLDVIRRISDVESKNEKWFVYWGPNSPYYDESYGTNAWEYFFKNVYEYEQGQHRDDVPDLVLQPGKNFRETINFYIQKHIKYTSLVEDVFEDFSKKIQQYNTLGVHIRKTDKNTPYFHGESDLALPIDNVVYKKYIDTLLERDKYDKIFLATDDAGTLEYFKDIYKNKVLYTNAFRGSDHHGVHLNYKNVSGFKKGLDVLIECLALSKCNFLLKSTSNVSSTAQFLNLNLKHININELERGDTRDHEFNLISEKINF